MHISKQQAQTTDIPGMAQSSVQINIKETAFFFVKMPKCLQNPLKIVENIM